MLKGIVDFFNPDAQQQQKPAGQQQQKPAGQQQKPAGQQQQKLVLLQKPQMPPLRETSTLFEEPEELSDAIIQEVNKQARQSGQQLAQMQKKELATAQLQEAKAAHEQILSYAQQIRTLIGEIRSMRQANIIHQEQAQQKRRRLRKAEEDAGVIVARLQALFQQISNARQQSQRTRLAQIQELKRIKHTLTQATLPVPEQQNMNKKVVQYDTPDGNKMRIQLSIHKDSKCCVAQNLAQKTRTYFRPEQKKIYL